MALTGSYLTHGGLIPAVYRTAEMAEVLSVRSHIE
jgi:hypothetical protein